MKETLHELINSCIKAGYKRDVTNVIYFWKIFISEALDISLKYGGEEENDNLQFEDAFFRIPHNPFIQELFCFLWKEISQRGKHRESWEEADRFFETGIWKNYLAPEGTHSKKMQDIYGHLKEVWDTYDLEWKYDF